VARERSRTVARPNDIVEAILSSYSIAGVGAAARAAAERGKQMAINKAHDEFHTLDLGSGWEVPAGYPSGIQQKILSGSLNESAKRGSRTRLLRFGPSVYTTKPFVHDYWEEVLLLAGDLTVGNDERGNGGKAFHPHTYACRPPGAVHGPFKSENGCLLLEIHYYDPA
jgi:hypothetical protein